MRSVLICGAVFLAAAASAAEEPAFRYAAPITVSSPGAFVQLPLPATAYGRSASANLADLRIVDARGERVPFAVLGLAVLATLVPVARLDLPEAERGVPLARAERRVLRRLLVDRAAARRDALPVADEARGRRHLGSTD